MAKPWNETDFETWYLAEYPRIVAALAVAARDRELAAEVASEAFVRAYERWDRLRRMERPGGWVHRTALNLLKRRLRRRTQEGRLLTTFAGPGIGGLGAPDLDLWRAVEQLPERTRTAIALRYLADLTEPEIAKAMGVGRGTVATLLHRARRQLEAELSDTHRPGVEAGYDPTEDSRYARH